jgi:Skp family chaperone for outer membrane proteins
MMDTRAKVEIACGVLVLALSLFGFRIWLEEHDDKLKAQADIAAAQKAFDQLAADRQSHEAADKARDDASAKQIDAMQKLASQIQTPAQIAAWLPKQVPGIPQPVTITIPPATAQNPQPDAIASIPQVDLPTLRNAVEKCQENSLRLSTCQQDLASRDAQMKLANTQIEQLKNEKSALQTELKGGTFWTRTKRAAKWLVIGAGIGAAAVCGTGHCK